MVNLVVQLLPRAPDYVVVNDEAVRLDRQNGASRDQREGQSGGDVGAITKDLTAVTSTVGVRCSP